MTARVLNQQPAYIRLPAGWVRLGEVVMLDGAPFVSAHYEGGRVDYVALISARHYVIAAAVPQDEAP